MTNREIRFGLVKAALIGNKALKPNITLEELKRFKEKKGEEV